MRTGGAKSTPFHYSSHPLQCPSGSINTVSSPLFFLFFPSQISSLFSSLFSSLIKIPKHPLGYQTPSFLSPRHQTCRTSTLQPCPSPQSPTMTRPRNGNPSASLHSSATATLKRLNGTRFSYSLSVLWSHSRKSSIVPPTLLSNQFHLLSLQSPSKQIECHQYSPVSA
jgi:hypothetical protein